THTAGCTGYTFRDLTEDIHLIARHWKKEGLFFDGIYTGYLGSVKQIDYVKNLLFPLVKKDGVKVVDPAMADNGRLYPAFNDDYVENMKTLCSEADIIVPNITEACLLTGTGYLEEYNAEYIEELISRLQSSFYASVVLTGVSFEPSTTGVAVKERMKPLDYYRHRRFTNGCHGTGDVYASVFVGKLLQGSSCFDAAKQAADFTVSCIENSAGDKDHTYGVKFEPLLGKLTAVSV
ncbi:MAG: bifunctional hydroxymethylpyrimidine kinase/phosphomethylpyrimidine kinase, partial [Sphaerochaetaceae bacterium]|nr:bifunctional hydroxymethylpyrimidine kinase/phosphomethylpyrimidine kinase [Sphaerochaetaceae bacterium]